MGATIHRPQKANSDGFDQSTGVTNSHVPSMADGCTVTGLTNSLVASTTASPGAVLGTGQNPDRYTPGAEAV